MESYKLKKNIINIKSITTVLVFLCAFSVQAQTIKPLEDEKLLTHMNQSNIYFKDVNNILDKYFGTWIYQDATHYLKITFFKREQVRMIGNKDWYFDELVCEYQYKRDDVEIYNTYGNNSNVDNYTANLILTSMVVSNNVLKLIYGEPPINSCDRTKSGSLKLEFLNNPSGSQPQLGCTRTNNSMTTNLPCDDGTLPDNSDFLIPANIILTQE